VQSNYGHEPISPVRWATKNDAPLEDTRRYWRKVNKRNNGRKAKTLRSHRTGR
jgi:hypothetical protein